MIFKVRCFTCGFIFTNDINKKWIEGCKKNIDRKELLDSLGLNRICCRTTIIGQINIVDKLPYTFN